MPDPNTSDFEVFDKKIANCQYAFYGIGTVNTTAVERPLTASRGRNVERFAPLQATDRVFHVDASGFANYDFSPATLDSSGSITEEHDHFLVDGSELAVVFAEFQNFRQSAIIVVR